MSSFVPTETVIKKRSKGVEETVSVLSVSLFILA